MFKHMYETDSIKKLDLRVGHYKEIRFLIVPPIKTFVCIDLGV